MGGTQPLRARLRLVWLVILLGAVTPDLASAGGGQGRREQPSARESAPIDMTGYWVSIVTEDWRFRMVTPQEATTRACPSTARDVGLRIHGIQDVTRRRARNAGGTVRRPS